VALLIPKEGGETGFLQGERGGIDYICFTLGKKVKGKREGEQKGKKPFKKGSGREETALSFE